MSEHTDENRPAHLFQKGQSGNPSGRPKGSRTKLGEQFVADLQKAWEAQGAEAIRRVIEERPQDFLKVVANMLPKELAVSTNHTYQVEEMTDEQLLARMRRLDDAIRPFIDAQRAGADSSGDGAETPH